MPTVCTFGYLYIPYFSTILLLESGKAQLTRGGDILQSFQLIDHGLWDHPAMDPNSCGVMATFAPIGPWPLSEHASSCSLPFALTLQFHWCMSIRTTTLHRHKL